MPWKALSPQDKIDCVEDMLQNGFDSIDIADRYCISRSTAYYWIHCAQSDDTYCSVRRERSLSNSKQWRRTLRINAIQHYSNGTMQCCMCSENRVTALGIDHVNGGGKRHRISIGSGGTKFLSWLRKNGYPAGYRVLCHNDNIREFRRKQSASNLGPERYRRQNSVVKSEVMNMLGGMCIQCGEKDIDVLTVHHEGNDGAVHRQEISNGRAGKCFYRAISQLGDLNGLTCMCYSCNDSALYESLGGFDAI